MKKDTCQHYGYTKSQKFVESIVNIFLSDVFSCFGLSPVLQFQ